MKHTQRMGDAIMALELVQPAPPRTTSLYLSGLVSVLPIPAHIIGQTSEGMAVLLSLTLLYAVSFLATLHIWFEPREAGRLPLLAKAAWTSAVFIAPVFVAPTYWALHVFLPSRARSADAGQRFVVLTKESNPLRAHMLKATLAAAQIPLRVHGTEDAAGVGMGQFIVAQRFEVHEEQLEDAKALLTSLEEAKFEDTPELSGEGELSEPPADSVALHIEEGTDDTPSRSLAEVALWVVMVLVALRLFGLL